MNSQERQAITIYDTNFKIFAIIDEYISLIWKQVFNGSTGGFDLEVPATKENIDIFKKDYYITRNDKNGLQPISKQQGGKSILQCQDVMIIEAIELSYDNEGKRSLVIGGSDITCILKRRIFADSFYISDKEYFGFFGKLGENLSLRGLPLYTFFGWYKLQGQTGLETYGDFLGCQDMGYLNTYSELAEPTAETVIRPDYALNYPYTHATTENRSYWLPDTIYTESIIARIKGNYYYLADRYYGFYPEQGQIIHYQNGYYILLQKLPNTPEITRQNLIMTESLAYWYLLPIPKPTQSTIYEYDTGSPTIYRGTAINGSGEAVYSNSGITNANWGDIYIYEPDLISTPNKIYICSLGGDPSTAKWTYFLTQDFNFNVHSLIPSDVLWGSGGDTINNINHNLVLVNGYNFPTEWDSSQTPFYALLDTGYTDLLLKRITGSYLTFTNEYLVENDTVTEFQLEKNIKHESYFDIFNDVMEEYQTGLKLYPDSDLSATTKFHYAIYNGEDRTGKDGGDLVIFSADFENLIKSKLTTDNSESANVAYISSKYPRNPADQNITEIELTTYTPITTPETIQRREVFIDKDISYRDGEGGAILQIQDFRNLLVAAGDQALKSEYQDEEKFDCEIQANNDLYKLNRDYFLGDKILIHDIWGNETKARIQETAETWNDDGYSIDLKLVYIPTDTIRPQGVIITNDNDYIITDDLDYIAYSEA